MILQICAAVKTKEVFSLCFTIEEDPELLKTFENISTLSTLVGFFKVMFMNVLDAKNAMDDLFWLVKNLLFVRWAQLEHEKTNRERIKKTKT